MTTDDQKNDHESQFLEAPFVRMLRMRSASLKSALCLWYILSVEFIFEGAFVFLSSVGYYKKL